MSSSEDEEVVAYTCIIVTLTGAASHLAIIIRERTWLYPISAFLAFVLSSKPTPYTCVFSSPDQMKSTFGFSSLPVHRTSEIPMISYRKRFISFLSSSNFPAAHSV
jgi:hypothetical protein